MAIPKPDPRDWQIANAQELQATDKEVLQLLRASKRRVDEILATLPTGKQEIRRAQLEQTRARLLAEQATVFERLGDVVAARRARSASRSARLSAAADAALLSLVGRDAQGQYLYDSALEVGQRAIDAAMARMRFSQLPLSRRIYNTSVWMGGRLGKLINETLASGLNAAEFAKRARDWFNPNTPGGVRYAAMRLARTEINNAFHSMSAAKYADTPWINEVEWNLSKSHPKKDICNEVHALSPYRADRVPARPHPQCMCYITPKPVDEDEFIDRFIAGEYDDYLDKELAANGWEEPEAAPQPAITPMVQAPPPTLTPPAWTPPNTGGPELSDDAWEQLSKRMDELKNAPPQLPVKKRRVKPADRPNEAALPGRARVKAPAEESEQVRQLGYRISDKINKRMQAKIKRVAAIAETHIGDKIKRIAGVESGIPKGSGHNAQNTFAIAYYDSGMVHLHSKFEAKGGEMAGCAHADHFVKGGDDAHETTLAHEFGHVFLSKGRLSTDAVNAFIQVIQTSLRLPNKATALSDDRQAALAMLDALIQNGDNSPQIIKMVSKYARTNANEFFAEIWAEYNMNPNCSEEIRAIGDLMRDYIRQDRKGLSALTY